MGRSLGHDVKRSAGFTLVEMATGLVIIGLVIGGILVGRDLIRAAELRSVLSEKEKYITAVITFRTKYGALPGDMANASDLWGLSGNCWRATGPGTATCNGNGDGRICEGGIYAGLGSCPSEGLYLWHHLVQAQIIAGNYNANSLLGPLYLINTNFPASKAFPHAGYMISYHGPYNGNDQFFLVNGAPGHVVSFGTQVSGGGFGNWLDNPLYPVLTTAEAMGIDAKIDDGKPSTGSVLALPRAHFNPTCTNANYDQPTIAVYDISQTGPQCALLFQAGF